MLSNTLRDDELISIVCGVLEAAKGLFIKYVTKTFHLLITSFEYSPKTENNKQWVIFYHKDLTLQKALMWTKRLTSKKKNKSIYFMINYPFLQNTKTLTRVTLKCRWKNNLINLSLAPWVLKTSPHFSISQQPFLKRATKANHFLIKKIFVIFIFGWWSTRKKN